MKTIAFHLNCLVQGGAERVVTNLANKFANEGYTVYVATEWYDENEYELDEKVTRIHVGLREEDEKKNRVTKFFLRIKYLKEFLRKYKPDVLVAFARRANYRALMAQKELGIPTVISIRIDPIGNYDFFSDFVQIRWLFPRAAGCVYQTAQQKEFFKPYLQEKSRIIMNPINPKFIGVEKPEHREKSVVNSARLVDFKNHAMLCRAFIRVHDKHPDYVLKIYGADNHDGTKETIEKIIADNKAENYILLMGGISNLEEELPKASVYAYSSDFEGMPNSLLEAMALGLPCISTDCPCGGPAAVIRHEENGLLIPVGDEDAMVSSINRLIEERDFAEKLGDEARNISKIASTDSIYRQWKEYLESIVDGAK